MRTSHKLSLVIMYNILVNAHKYILYIYKEKEEAAPSPNTESESKKKSLTKRKCFWKN